MKTTDKSPRQLWCRNRSVFCCLSDLTSTPKRGCHNESTRQTLHQRSSIAQRTPTIRHGEKMPFVRAAAKQGVLWCVNFGGKLCNPATPSPLFSRTLRAAVQCAPQIQLCRSCPQRLGLTAIAVQGGPARKLQRELECQRHPPRPSNTGQLCGI
jgi:hypothetical protein